ncbi:hypothetical protein NpPPO83_00012524 [Neofusicoccum parvum]|uniref:Uncharacterized protein n=1 Tax=Neofusicoccum parvum TaxID=310453 RepID=A0ACB5SMN1_9PEZI|nr:hypothetical protein NpPPO83_00012524 [Neofusicoccum parvum]
MLLINAILMLPLVAGSAVSRRDGKTTTIYTTVTEAPIFSISLETPRFSNATSFISITTKAPHLNQTTSSFTVATAAPPLRPVDVNITMTASTKRGNASAVTGVPANGLDFMPPRS